MGPLELKMSAIFILVLVIVVFVPIPDICKFLISFIFYIACLFIREEE